MGLCERGDLVAIEGSWGVERFIVNAIHPKTSEYQWRLELVPVNNDDPLRHSRRIHVTNDDMVNYGLELTIESKWGEYDADFD